MASPFAADAVNGSAELQVDRFGLSIGSVSVGLPICGTIDDVFGRYLDLVAILQRGPLVLREVPEADLDTLCEATGSDRAFVIQRLEACARGTDRSTCEQPCLP